MAVNLTANRQVLLTAYSDVISETSPTDWALFTYEDTTDNLTLICSGEEGLAGITPLFDNGRIMYGFLGVKEPASAVLPQYILINWVGEDVADARKCTCASHVATIADFFQGVNLTVNASCLEDIDPSAISQRLTNGAATGTGAVLSRLRAKEDDNVGSNLQKANSAVEVRNMNWEQFWLQAQREEEQRKEEDRKRALEERQRFEEERQALELREQEERDKRNRERDTQIEECRRKRVEEEEEVEKAQRRITPELEEQTQPDKKEVEVSEAAAIIAQRTSNPRDYFRQRERSLVSPHSPSASAPIQRPGRVESPFLSQQCSASASPVLQQSGIPDGLSDDVAMNVAPTPPDSPPAAPKPPPSIPTTIPTIITTSTQDSDHTMEWGEADPSALSYSDTLTDDQPFCPSSAGPDPFGDSFGEPQPSSTTTSHHGPNAASSSSSSSSSTSSTTSSAVAGGRPQPLLSFDEVLEQADSSFVGVEEEPSSLVNVSGAEQEQDQMTSSYQQALQHASLASLAGLQDLDLGLGERDSPLLMTNGDAQQQQQKQGNDGYFSHEGESHEDTIPKMPMYSTPPAIDVTCWDADGDD
ncbi:drebrin isoform X2 [Alosa pseudoharengus]|uniref:drebrin isoform X2 n=1 Tax=Alosa pseudoharengus TaxID=34774 RepID=UPI003F8AD5D2